MELTDADLQTIRERAYFKWLDAGAPCCDGVDYWLDAESDFLHDGDRIDAERSAANRRDTTRPLTRPANRRAWPTLADEDELVGARD